jgi:hypothetical protein
MARISVLRIRDISEIRGFSICSLLDGLPSYKLSGPETTMTI